jgi:hypothetical protein
MRLLTTRFVQRRIAVMMRMRVTLSVRTVLMTNVRIGGNTSGRAAAVFARTVQRVQSHAAQNLDNVGQQHRAEEYPAGKAHNKRKDKRFSFRPDQSCEVRLC